MDEGEEMVKIGELPDELRCKRSDGRQWRCKKRVVGESKMCAYHLCRSRGKSWTERKVGGVGVVDGVELSAENKMVENGVGLGRSLSASGRKRKSTKRYYSDEEGKDSKKEGNADVSSKKCGREEVEVVAAGCSVSSSGRKRKPVKRYDDGDEEDLNLNRGSNKKEGDVDVLTDSKNLKRDERVVSVRRLALAEEIVPDHLRCMRTDGKRWRCSRRVKDGATMCENHYLRGRLRQVKEVVPESLKLQRRDKFSLFKCSQLYVSKFGGMKKRRPVKWRQWSNFSEMLDDALRKLQLKKSDTELQLLKAYLKRQAEKLEMQQHFSAAEGYCQKEVTKDLPFGAMTISASPKSQAFWVAGSSSSVKIGSDPDSLSGVSFRSKNIEPVPIGSSKVMPGVNEIVRFKRAKKRCHLCNKLDSTLAKCSACKKEYFCIECIKERYLLSRVDVEKACPVCCTQCNCESCELTQSKDAEHQESQIIERRMEKVGHARNLIYLLLSALKRIKDEQRINLKLEANIQGKEHCEVCIEPVLSDCNKQFHCENCRSSNEDTQRSFSEGLTKDWDTLLSNYFDKTMNTKRLSRELIANGWHDLLVLKRVFTSRWINELEKGAEKAVSSFHYTDGADVSSCCDVGHKPETVNQMQLASSRRNSNDSYLYYPSIKDGQLLENFQKNWQKHHPAVVCNVLHSTPELSWDPIFFFCSYLERCHADSLDDAEVEASYWLNWCEVEIGIRQSYMGQSKGWNRAKMWDETLKLKGCLSSYIFKNKFPEHYDGIVQSLPHQEYMNPTVGRSNLAVNLPPEVKPDLGPHVHISYGISLDGVDSMGPLCYNSYDSVYIMVHATEDLVTSEQVTQVRKLMEKKWLEYHEASTRTSSDATMSRKNGNGSKKDSILKRVGLSNKDSETVTTFGGESGESCNSVVVQEPSRRSTANVNKHQESRSDSEDSNLYSEEPGGQIEVRNVGNIKAEDDDDSPSVSCGAEWDVFRREDISSLLDYLRKHSDELSHPNIISNGGAQPVLGQSVFLDLKQKSTLKEEFNIEPWNFKQQVGEAVIIPAGCPYQIRTFKDNRISNEDKIEVKKMVLYNISAALQQLTELI